MYLMEYSDNYYVRTKSYELDPNKLTEFIQCDVCIIGGGYRVSPPHIISVKSTLI